jgi:voltage-gated potassium channel
MARRRSVPAAQIGADQAQLARRYPTHEPDRTKNCAAAFFVAIGHAIHITWPVLSTILAIQVALGLFIGFLESWSGRDAVYLTFVTGLTIGYGDLVPRQALARVLAIGIGSPGSFSQAPSRELRSTPCV